MLGFIFPIQCLSLNPQLENALVSIKVNVFQRPGSVIAKHSFSHVVLLSSEILHFTNKSLPILGMSSRYSTTYLGVHHDLRKNSGVDGYPGPTIWQPFGIMRSEHNQKY